MSQLPILGTNGSKPAHLSLAAAPPTGQAVVPVSPIDLRPLAPVPMATTAQVQAAVERGRLAQPYWQKTSFPERARLLETAAREMLRRRAEVVALARAEMGKVPVEGLFNEAIGPLETLRGWISVIGKHGQTRKVWLNPLSFAGKRASVTPVARGVVGIIAPWNYPVSGLYRSVFPALLTGNAVVLKPSEYTPRTSAWFLELLAAALPDDVAQVVQGDGEVGAALIDAGIDACVFTGSPSTGAKVRTRCAERGIPASIEMGGKDGAIVLADCDLPRTVAGLTQWSLSNAGQACGAIEIVYAERSVADRLVERLASAFRRLRVGVTADADVAPLANQRQLEIVRTQVEEAQKLGARLVCGGRATGAGLTFEPTLLDHCTAEMAVVRDETFGPVVAVVRVSGAEEAIRQINASRYGLGASIWTRDLARGQRLAERLDVGVVTINNHAFTGAIPALPWSGTRETGYGVANGPESLATFVRPRTLVVDSSSSPEAFWLPFDATFDRFLELLADAQLGKLTQAWRLPLLMRKRVRMLKDFFE